MDVKNETSIDRLRQMAVILESENRQLHRRLSELASELELLRGQEGKALQQEIELLKETLADRTRALFGASTEQRPKGDEKPKERQPRSKTGRREQKQLPVVNEPHELDEADRICTQCGGGLEEMNGQFEESEEIDVVERSFRILHHKRKKYRCRCGGCVETAPGPLKLQPGARYSIDFAVDVAEAKYCFHAPLERQVKQMARDGLVIDSQTLWDQLWALAGHLTPTAEALHAYVLSQPVIGADETRWPMMEKGATKTWMSWAITCPTGVSHRILEGRSAKEGFAVLGNFGGTVVADGYAAYSAVQRAQVEACIVPFTLAYCMAHVRRKLLAAESKYPVAKEALDLIGTLYEIERRARTEAEEAGDLEERLRLMRQRESKPVVEKLRIWVAHTRHLPESSLGKAIRYMDDLWTGLTRFVDDPRLPLDSSQTEREMRPLAVGRHNHYGSRSERGTHVAALFYSLVESARLNGVPPRAYLAAVARRAIATPGTVLLPHDYARELAEQ